MSTAFRKLTACSIRQKFGQSIGCSLHALHLRPERACGEMVPATGASRLVKILNADWDRVRVGKAHLEVRLHGRNVDQGSIIWTRKSHLYPQRQPSPKKVAYGYQIAYGSGTGWLHQRTRHRQFSPPRRRKTPLWQYHGTQARHR